jgi:ADP-ribose pyrophosphatase YjhB (NUDIX family)
MMLADEVNFCPRCGTALIVQHRVGQKRPVCPSCDWIFFPDPKVAAAVLLQQTGRVLLVRRANQPKRGFWTLPVGFVDASEDPARAAERECLEETGLKVQVTELLDVISNQEHPRGANILIVYRAEIIAGDAQPGDDVDRVGFFPLDHLPPLAFQTTAKILQDFGSL